MWRWRDPAPSVASGPSRSHGLVRSAIGLTAAGVLYAIGWRTVAMVAAGIALATGLLAFASPDRGYRMLASGLDRFARAVGVVLTWLVMVPIFFLWFLPFGVLFRRGRADPMKRAWDRAAASYWQPRADDMTAPARHERPY
jgi:hypothetical protein